MPHSKLVNPTFSIVTVSWQLIRRLKRHLGLLIVCGNAPQQYGSGQQRLIFGEIKWQCRGWLMHLEILLNIFRNCGFPPMAMFALNATQNWRKTWWANKQKKAAITAVSHSPVILLEFFPCMLQGLMHFDIFYQEVKAGANRLPEGE